MEQGSGAVDVRRRLVVSYLYMGLKRSNRRVEWNRAGTVKL